MERYLPGAKTEAATRVAEEYLVTPLHDRAQIRELLWPHRPYAAYALGQLDPNRFIASRWWLAQGREESALIVHSKAGLGNATVALGDPNGLEALLRLHPGPRQTFATCRTEHLPVLVHHFYLSHQNPMMRMQATRETFIASGGNGVERLTGREARLINRLYSTEGIPSTYAPRQIEDGIYFGARIDGRLAAVAGTHVVSPAYGVAVVGNVYTHPHYRGRGLAGAVTGAVTAEALKRCEIVVLSVDPRNRAAVRAYERLGYREVCRLIEAAATRRDIVGGAAALQRLVAALRGRGRGGAVVKL